MFTYHSEYVKNEEFGFLYMVTITRENADGTHNTVFKSGKYVTKQMAMADALCWVEFHADEMEEKEEEPVIKRYKVEVACAKKGVSGAMIVEVPAKGENEEEAIAAAELYLKHNTIYVPVPGLTRKAIRK